MSEGIVEITDQNFDSEVLKAEQPVLVDFWAEWCAPCRMLAPVIERIADTYDDQLKVGKMDVDANQEIPSQMGIMSIPTLILFKEGEPATRFVGVLPEQQLKEELDRYL